MLPMPAPSNTSNISYLSNSALNPSPGISVKARLVSKSVPAITGSKLKNDRNVRAKAARALVPVVDLRSP